MYMPVKQIHNYTNAQFYLHEHYYNTDECFDFRGPLVYKTQGILKFLIRLRICKVITCTRTKFIKGHCDCLANQSKVTVPKSLLKLNFN